jgi:TetR/AcrR family transcriptional repressor of nem operon
VSEITAAAGLTHGGFYAHLRSKDDVVAQAIGQMFDAACANLLARTESRPSAKGLADYIDSYLAPSQWVDIANGCPIAAPSGALHHAGRGSAMSHA